MSAQVIVPWSKWLDWTKKWTIFELLHPTQSVLSDVVPKMQSFKRKKAPGSPEIQIKEYAADLGEAAKNSPAITEAYMEQRAPFSPAIREDDEYAGFIKDMIEYGFTDQSFLDTLLTLHPMLEAPDPSDITEQMKACYMAYKVVGMDAHCTEQDIADAVNLFRLQRDAGKKWQVYTNIYTTAYLLRVIREKTSQLNVAKATIRSMELS